MITYSMLAERLSSESLHDKTSVMCVRVRVRISTVERQGKVRAGFDGA